MNDNDGYAVFFFPQALEALGDAIKPYLQEGPAGPHVVCNGVDTGGSLIEMSLNGTTQDGTAVELELMIPSGMVRMIVSAHSDDVFGFGPHVMKGAVQRVVPMLGDASVQEGEADLPPAPTRTPEPAQPETAAQQAKQHQTAHAAKGEA